MNKTIILLMMLLSFEGMLFADVIYLKSGAKVEGIIVQEGESKVIIALGVGEVTYPRDKIESISRATEEENAKFQDRWDALKKQRQSTYLKKKEKRSLTAEQREKPVPSGKAELSQVAYTVAFHDELNKKDYRYAVRLPALYNNKDRSPVLFVFDPEGKGIEAAAKFSYAADKLGWIVLGMLDCPQDEWMVAVETQEAMLRDIVKRFRTDQRRFYAAGFGDGTRMAFRITYIHHEQFKGIIACDGGFSIGGERIDQNIPVYACIGRADKNAWEAKAVYDKLREMEIVTCLEEFDGGHDWPPAEVITKALDWIAEKTK